MDEAKKDQTTEDRRLWIGNLDPRVTEYHLLKLVQKHGAIEKFDLLFHRTGPLAGQPRGYAFVTYVNQEDAVQAKQVLNNVLVGQRKIVVTWAHSVNNEEVEKPKPEINIPALAMSKNEKKTDRESQIQAIEAKLKLMEKKAEDELKINDTVATKPPVITQFQYNKQTVTNNSLKTKTLLKRHDKYVKPYSKQKNSR
ncbi:probable RNA-binding protein 18 [Tribolium castaneum]|uniref:probable RNA-binding protein 18 n=1 Tax=Tribolium castaneum TaxID=7070 RepID=UPI0001DCBF64|nr:PREDICTED: probable RNA-binding protein 18 [Tribolium castaneum]|eukprot:XP_008191219.1 PREDICTED: probable RNA-binding protein 18 [Tribolium castaneum]